jgi:predicted RNA-binding protein (virulence factor B family)
MPIQKNEATQNPVLRFKVNSIYPQKGNDCVIEVNYDKNMRVLIRIAESLTGR